MNWRKIQLVENLVKSYLVDKDILYTATKYCHPSLLFRQFKFRRKFRNPAAQLFENRNFSIQSYEACSTRIRLASRARSDH